MMEKRTSRVSEAQWDILLEYLEKYPNLVKARGYNNSAKGRKESARLWQTIADVLNAEGLGAIKTPKDWSIYVSNYKSKLKKIVADINADAAATGGGPPQAIGELSDQDTRFLALLGPGFGQATPSVRVNPFPDDVGPSTSGVPTPPRALNEYPEALDQEEVSQDRSSSRSPVNLNPDLIDVWNIVEEIDIVDNNQVPEAAAGPRIPRQTRRPRYRTRPLAPIDEARRILQQVELQRAAADTARAQALNLIGLNLGRLAAAMEAYVAHIWRQP